MVDRADCPLIENPGLTEVTKALFSLPDGAKLILSE